MIRLKRRFGRMDNVLISLVRSQFAVPFTHLPRTVLKQRDDDVDEDGITCVTESLPLFSQTRDALRLLRHRAMRNAVTK